MRILAVLFLLLMSFQTIQAEVRTGTTAFNIGSETASEEGIVVLNLPSSIALSKIESMLLSEGSPFQSIQHLLLNPSDQTIDIKGKIRFPKGIVNDLENEVNYQGLDEIFDLDVKVRFPSHKLLSRTSYFQIEFLKFHLGGVDYLNAFETLSFFVKSMIGSKGFMSHVLGSEQYQSVNDLIQLKNIRIRNRRVSVKLNLGTMPTLKDYTEFGDLKLWFFGPTLLKGSGLSVFRIEAGLGKPAEVWGERITERLDMNQDLIARANQDLYQTFHINALKAELDKHQVGLSEEYGTLHQQYQSVWETFVGRKYGFAAEELSLENGSYRDHPETFFLTLLDQLKVMMTDRYLDLVSESKQYRQQFVSKRRSGKPILEKWVSQKAIDQIVRFFRDVELDKEQLFPEIHIKLAPQKPGFVIKGKINFSIKDLLNDNFSSMGLEFFDEVYLDQSRFGHAIPFEVSISTFYYPSGKLGIDISSIKLLEGAERVVFTDHGQHGRWMNKFVKLLVGKTLASILIEVNDSENEGEVVEESEKLRLLSGRISRLQREMEEVLIQDSMSLDEKFVALSQIEVEKNPFIEEEVQRATGKTRAIFEDLFGVDGENEQLTFLIDAGAVAKVEFDVVNELKVWEFRPIYSSRDNQVYLKAAIGRGEASQDFLDLWRNSSEENDSLNFVGLRDETNSLLGPDLKLKVDSEELSQVVNQILEDITSKERAKEAIVKEREEESKTSYLRSAEVDASPDRLKLNLAFKTVEKEERSVLNPRRYSRGKFSYEEKIYRADATVALKLVTKEELNSKGIEVQDELFYSDLFYEIELLNAGLEVDGGSGVLDTLINFALSHIEFSNGRDEGKLMGLLTYFLGDYIHPSKESSEHENVILGGVRINQYAKVLAKKGRIYLNLHPHLAGKGVEIAPIQEANQKLIEQSINLNFTTHSSFATIDKKLVAKLIKKGILLSTSLNKPNLSEQEFIQLMDELIHSSDETKPSLWHQYLKVLGAYPEVIAATEINLGGIISEQAVDAKFVTSLTGVDTIYLAMGAYGLMRIYRKILNETEFPSAYRDYQREIENRQVVLKEKVLKPLLNYYQGKASGQNQKMIQKGITDWNRSLYSQAVFTHSAYQLLLTELDQ